MTTITATNARGHFFEMLKQATEDHEIYHIQTRNGVAVLMSEEEYESLLETLELLSQPGLKESLQRSLAQIEKRQTFSMQEVLGEE